MALLLDTHVLLWVLADDRRLAGAVREAITDGSARVLVSAASAWEIAIKQALGKLRAPDDLIQQIAALRYEPLPITLAHALAVADLPHHHTDPFDRLLVAQARSDGLTLVTADRQLTAYDIAVMEV